MQIDLTITLGNILTIIGTLISVTLMTFSLVSRLQRVEWKLNMIWKWYAKTHNLDGDGEDK